MCLVCGCGDRTALVCPECGGRVILINGETKCLSCGASPSLEAASPGQEEHRHHHHHHADQAHAHREAAEGAIEELLVKLRVLLPHWIEHNAEHAESFCIWAERARAAGDGHLAAHIEEAAAKIQAANRDLEGVVEHIGAVASDHVHLHHEHSH